MMNFIAAACLTAAYSPYCNAERVVVCQPKNDAVVCVETQPLELMSKEEKHLRRPGGGSTVDYIVRYRAQ